MQLGVQLYGAMDLFGRIPRGFYPNWPMPDIRTSSPVWPSGILWSRSLKNGESPSGCPERWRGSGQWQNGRTFHSLLPFL